jgi:hypothetical protein
MAAHITKTKPSAPFVCVPKFTGWLAVWWLTPPKSKPKPNTFFLLTPRHGGSPTKTKTKIYYIITAHT